MHSFSALSGPAVAELASIVGAGNVSESREDRDLRSHDMSGHSAHLSDVIVWPATAEQVTQMLRFASEQRIAVTPWGAGTSVEGNPIPVRGGILLSLERMNRIVTVHANDMQVTVEAGVKYRDLNRALQDLGLFFPVDPGGDATIGGMLANNAAGPKTVKYGASKDNVLWMQVALTDGRLIEVGSRSIKQSSGYDLLHLFVGSEGTLGVITQATLKLAPLPKHIGAAVASFDSVGSAIAAVAALKRSGLDIGALEFMDAGQMRMINVQTAMRLDERPTLFMEFHAPDPHALEACVEQAEDLCRSTGALTLQATVDPTERQRLWYARHNAYTIATRVHAGERFLTTDAAVPISALAELIAFIESELTQRQLTGYLLGHVGDGNVHVLLPYRDVAEYDEAQQLNEAIVLRALELGGTATGEHGVGLGKVKFMRREHGPALDVMLGIKRLLDPNGILNPGKVLPGESTNPFSEGPRKGKKLGF